MAEKFNVIVVGASAGGVEALVRLIGTLPHDLNAPLLVVMHVPPTAPSALPQILSRANRLAATYPVNGQRLQQGRIYVAPPDYHLLLQAGGTVELTRGPREHSCRPAVDPLFRSAALHYGPNAIGVVLSGTLDDGTAGLSAIKAAGGICIVQDPKDSLFAGMPESAIEHVSTDFILPSSQIGALLGELCTSPNGGHLHRYPTIGTEVDIDALRSDPNATKKLGPPSEFACPECGGTLWSIQQEDGDERYRCRVGHAYSSQSLMESQNDSFERALWTAIRALREKADLTMKISRSFRSKENYKLADRFERNSKKSNDEAEILLSMLRNPVPEDKDVPASSEPESFSAEPWAPIRAQKENS
jgi:two-component system chemotaxis response regulator CheB